MQEVIITSLEKLRLISGVVQGLKQQVNQLENLLSETRKEIIKLKGENNENIRKNTR